MVNEKTGQRELAYVVRIDAVEPIVGSDNCECAVVGGWKVMVRKGTFSAYDLGIYFEIDSKLDISKPEFAFLEKCGGKIRTQKYKFGQKGPNVVPFFSQGLLMSPEDFGWVIDEADGSIIIPPAEQMGSTEVLLEGDFLTERLGVTYADADDNTRKKSLNKYEKMRNAHKKLFERKFFNWLYEKSWGKKILYRFLKPSKKYDLSTEWPSGRFKGVSKTDQERVENMPYILKDKTPYIRTQKCDGSSATYILERTNNKKTPFEFYVCSRNRRIPRPASKWEADGFWEMVYKYDIESVLQKYLESNPDKTFVCIQGELVGPSIQGNPHKLKEKHLFCFHMTDSKNGRFDIRAAYVLWKAWGFESVPIDKELVVLPDDMEEFKQSADGYYDESVCEGNKKCKREGYVYYSIDDPTKSFKNVSREYLMKK